ncbi:putative RNA-directed DNA polymerase from transposon X-element [Caerostris darwini]|uniref:RNA-directed DNA polymerase from transposon X-element n=1 Tax=Caerostris darwini TaxID=1538125 RepID=A0AAV4MTM5_9ARAC|nr:putative RNA-directed DNA polymerase from transposon X-element [Caerostris darwini]
MFSLIKKFLSRFFCAARFEDSISCFKRSETGLPEDTAVSTTLFNDFISMLYDLPGILNSDGLALSEYNLVIWYSASKRDQSRLNTTLNLALEVLDYLCTENNMTINLEKTTSQFFTLNGQPFTPCIVSRGTVSRYNPVSACMSASLIPN